MVACLWNFFHDTIIIEINMVILQLYIFIRCLTSVFSIPEVGLIKHVTKVSYRSCRLSCDSAVKCTTAIYNRRFTLCKLFSIPYQGTPLPGEKVYSRCTPDDVTCTAHRGLSGLSCGTPPDLPSSQIFGNMVHTGSKIKYRCIGDTNFAISTCKEDERWTAVDLQCRCSKVKEYNYMTIENVESWTFNTSETKVVAEPICRDGYVLRDRTLPTECLLTTTNTWSNVGENCCEKFRDGQWLRIYSYPSVPGAGDRVGSWTGSNPQKAYCQYQNKSYIDNWITHTPNVVNLTVIKDEKVVAWIAFDGQVQGNTDWMTNSKFLNSSWQGLMAKPLAEIQIDLDPNERSKNMRFLVGVKNTIPSSWSYPKGWLVVTDKDLVYNTGQLRPLIFYSKTGEDVEFHVANADLTGKADRLEAWVTV